MNFSLLVILRMSLSHCKANLHVLPGRPECWNVRSADLHPPGLVETWYEWNLHTQDILFQWNMSTWIHFSAVSWPAQKVSSASFYIPEKRERGSRMTALSQRYCSVIDCFLVVCYVEKVIHRPLSILFYIKKISTPSTLTCMSDEDINRRDGIINYFFFNSAVIVEVLSAVASN